MIQPIHVDFSNTRIIYLHSLSRKYCSDLPEFLGSNMLLKTHLTFALIKVEEHVRGWIGAHHPRFQFPAVFRRSIHLRSTKRRDIMLLISLYKLCGPSMPVGARRLPSSLTQVRGIIQRCTSTSAASYVKFPSHKSGSPNGAIESLRDQRKSRKDKAIGPAPRVADISAQSNADTKTKINKSSKKADPIRSTKKKMAASRSPLASSNERPLDANNETKKGKTKNSLVEIWVDASSTGIGFIWDGKWLAWAFINTPTKPMTTNSAWSELIAVEMGLRALMAGGHRSMTATVWTDNKGVVTALTKGRCRSRGLGLDEIVEEIKSLSAKGNITVEAGWISTETNPADKPSRGIIPDNLKRYPCQPRIPSRLAGVLRNWLKPSTTIQLCRDLPTSDRIELKAVSELA